MNVQPIATAIDSGLDKIKSTIEAQPKSITKQFRVLLFPEYNAMEYYKLVFGRVLFWMLMFLIVTYLYLLAKMFIEKHEVRQVEAEALQYRIAWNYLYYSSKKGVRVRMDSVRSMLCRVYQATDPLML